MGSGDKGQEARGCGVSPQPWPQPLQRRQAAVSRYRVPQPKPSPEAAAFPGGAEMSSLPQGWLLTWHRDLRVGSVEPAARPPPHHTPITGYAHPAALNSAQGFTLCPGKAERPSGQPTAPPGVCQALIKLCACIDAAGFSSQPDKEGSAQPDAGQQRDGCMDA